MPLNCRLQPLQQHPLHAAISTTTTATCTAMADTENNLPNLDVPVFDGKYEQSISLFHLFKGSNESCTILIDCQKQQPLRESVIGDTASNHLWATNIC